MPKINIQDGVREVSGYEGVRTKVEFITAFNTTLGMIFFGLHFFMIIQNDTLMKIGLLMLAVGIFGFLFTRSIKVQVLQNGVWNTVSKYNYSDGQKVKKQLMAQLGKD